MGRLRREERLTLPGPLGDRIGRGIARRGFRTAWRRMRDVRLREIAVRLAAGLEVAAIRAMRLPVGDRNPVIVGMNLAEREEPMAVAAVFDEGCLE